MGSAKWRRRLSNIFLLISMLILEAVALFGVRSALAAQQLEGQFILHGNPRIDMPIPSQSLLPALVTAKPGPPNAAEPTTILTGTNELTKTGQLPVIPQVTEDVSIPKPPTSSITPNPTNTQALPPSQKVAPLVPEPTPMVLPSPTPSPSSGRIVRLVIPSLKVDRAVVPLGLYTNAQGKPDWNTEKLFATANRKDLIGQTITSLNPGQGGNIVLMGHNYDNGVYEWEGVFVNIKNLNAGELIIAYTEGGGEYHYAVQIVKKVPWQDESQAEAEKHFKYLGPSPNEQLTLVTCGGANVWPWQARLYVVAIPIK